MIFNGTASAKVCSVCIVDANSGNSASPVAFRTRLGSASSDSSIPGSDVSTGPFQASTNPPAVLPLPSAPESALAEILDKLNRMDARGKSFETGMETRMGNFQAEVTAKLSALGAIPALVQKVDAVVSDVAALNERVVSIETEQRQLRVAVAEMSAEGQ